MNQGEPVYPTILNIVVDAVARSILIEVCGPQEAHHGLVWAVGEQDIIFYANDGHIMGRNPI